MAETMISIIAVVVAYLIGSISSAIITCKIMGLPDPRESGSGNPGATNVLRVGGKKAAIITLLSDALKGYFPVQIAYWLGFSEVVIAFAAVAAFAGHLYPIFFRFQGGKGVATCFGALIALNGALAIIVLGIWILIFSVFRYSSLAALTAIAIGLLYAWHIIPMPYYIAFAVMGLTLFWRHRENIDRLIKGKESKFGKKKS